MGKKGSSSSQQAPVIMQQAPAPQVIEFAMPALPPMPDLPAMPEIPAMPTPTYIPPYDPAEDERIQAQNRRELEKRNRLRVGRKDTIVTSPLGVQEEAEIKKVQLLGG